MYNWMMENWWIFAGLWLVIGFIVGWLFGQLCINDRSEHD
jgi:uncharacterized membrane-anchored protein YhcB (DUF1043 family)